MIHLDDLLLFGMLADCTWVIVSIAAIAYYAMVSNFVNWKKENW